MLKTREPLKLHTMDIASSGAEQFFERIASNYEQIDARISGTDLLHMVTQPPEFFYAEGDESIFLNNNINFENKQTKKVEILNNLVNRIMLSTNGQFTYQDQVYVSNTLRKLGITNEQQFIKDIYNNINETKNIKEHIESVTNVAAAIKNQVENVSSITFNRYERNYIAGQVTRIANQYQQRFFAEINRLIDASYSKEDIIDETQNIVDKINESIAQTIISKANEDHRLYITSRVSTLNNEEKAAFYEIFNKTYGNSFYKELTEIKVEKLIQKVVSSVATAPEHKTPAELIKQASERPQDNYSAPLYQAVVNRIDLTNIYQEVINKLSNYNEDQSFNSNEVNLTSFSRLVNEVNLKNAKDVLIAPANISYVLGDIYEHQEDFDEINEEKVNQQLTKAILYSIVETTFNTAINREENTSNKWYQVTDNLYSTADNTISRFEENLLAPVDRSVYQSLTEEAIIEQLEAVEIENNNRVQLYQQAIENEMKSRKGEQQQKQHSAAKAKADTIEALNNPQEFLERVREEKQQAAIKKAFENQDALDRLPPEVRSRIELIQAITTSDEDGNIPEEGLKVISNVQNEIFNNSTSVNRIERIQQTINQELEAGIITEVEEQAILKELSEVNTLLKEDRRENPNRPLASDSPKKAHALEILNKIEQRIENNIYRNRGEDIENISLTLRQGDILSPELVNIVENLNLSPGQTVLGDTIVEAMQPELKRVAIESFKSEAAKTVEDVIVSDGQGTVRTFIKKNAPAIVNNVSEEISQMNLVHKTVDQIDTEEIIERLEEQKQILKTERVINTTSQTNVTETNVTESTRKLIQSEIENLEIQDQIDKTLQQQISTLESEMFDKLENRLDNERRRRGF